MIPELKPEILTLIFKHLINPLPKRHSYRVYDRSFMRQPEFFALLQTSKVMYNIAAPILYRVVVVDDLGLLLLGSGKNQQIPDIIPKWELLSQTRALFIEYRLLDEYELKGVNRKDQGKGEGKPSKRDLERKERDKHEDRWARKRLGLHPDFEVKCRVKGVLIQLGKELKMLQGATQELIGYPGRRKKPLFQRLEKLSIGAFFGSHQQPPFFFMDEERAETEEDLWKKLLKNTEYQKVLSEVRGNLSLFVASTPSIRHFCQSPSDAALCLGIVSYLPKGTDTRPSIAFHTHARGVLKQPTAVGIPFTQYVHSTQWEDARSEGLFEEIERNFLEAVHDRQVAYQKDAKARKSVPTWDIECHLYRSIPPPDTYSKQGDDIVPCHYRARRGARLIGGNRPSTSNLA